MKVVFLNIWGGKMYELLRAFLREQASATDFFCFQEVFDSPDAREVSGGGRANMLAELVSTLPDFDYRYMPMAEGCDGDNFDNGISWGLAIFSGKGLRVESCGVTSVTSHEVPHGDKLYPLHPHHRTLQHVRFRKDATHHTLLQFHGIAYPGSKLDTPERLEQSRKIVEFLGGIPGEKILGGDFNLMPDTEGIGMIERAGMRNLITEYGITTTRNTLSYGQYAEHERQYFADYAFVSSGVTVRDFTVPQVEVSDHLPLILEFA